MATIHTLIACGDLIKLDPCLPPNELENRLIHASPKLQTWLDNVLPTLVSSRPGELSPQEQMAIFVEDFCGGSALTYPFQIHPMHHAGGGVWVLKTYDVRVFGWFHIPDCFIGVAANDATFIKMHDLYNGYCGEVVIFRNNLNIDLPKYIHGSLPDAVISNCYPS